MQVTDQNTMVIKELKVSIFGSSILDCDRFIFDKFEYQISKSDEQDVENYLHFAFMRKFKSAPRIWEHWTLNKSDTHPVGNVN
jgi:hypothetical protein